jgi:hypothetical protein
MCVRVCERERDREREIYFINLSDVERERAIRNAPGQH